jgi:NAD(P)-dependent dehydrogenase (short-subunit alcohol dehydrogenase family)
VTVTPDPVAFLGRTFGLAGQVALVTGASRGIGRSIAEQLGQAGAAVMIAARNAEACAEVVAGICDKGADAAFARVNLSDEQSISAMVKATVQRFGGVDILVNCAGIFPPGRILAAGTDHWDEVHKINLRAAYLCLREAARQMRQQGRGGRIVNISSMGSLGPAAPGRFAYDAAKAALNRLTEDASIEFARDGITVNAVLPGAIETSHTAVVPDGPVPNRLIERIPLRRKGTPEEIGAAVLYLCSKAASYVTGHKLLVDGGFTIGQ